MNRYIQRGAQRRFVRGLHRGGRGRSHWIHNICEKPAKNYITILSNVNLYSNKQRCDVEYTSKKYLKHDLFARRYSRLLLQAVRSGLAREKGRGTESDLAGDK